MKRILFIISISLVCFLQSCEEPKVKKEDPKDLESLLIMYPDSISLLLIHGNEMILNNDYGKAMADGAKAFRLDSNNLEARMLYAEVLNNRSERSISDINFAQKHYLVIVGKQPKNLKALIGLAATYSQQQDFEASFKYINQALRINPKYRDAYVLKGSNYRLLGNIDYAKSSYETAIQQDPEFTAAYVYLGLLYEAEENPVCIEYLTTALELNKNDVEIKYTLADALEKFKKYESAELLYREMAIDTSEFYIARGLFHLGNLKQFIDNDVDSAIYYYNSATDTKYDFVEAWHNLGLCYKDQGDKTRALQSFAKALKYNPEFKLSRDAADALK